VVTGAHHRRPPERKAETPAFRSTTPILRRRCIRPYPARVLVRKALLVSHQMQSRTSFTIDYATRATARCSSALGRLSMVPSLLGPGRPRELAPPTIDLDARPPSTSPACCAVLAFAKILTNHWGGSKLQGADGLIAGQEPSARGKFKSLPRQ
jgi:hypothetical protein